MSNYRLLRVGEITLAGDERYTARDKWHDVVFSVGTSTSAEDLIRRRIKGYVPVEVYETVYAIENITEHNIETINECMDIVMSLANSNFPIMDSKMESDITDVRLKLDDKKLHCG